MDNKIENFKSFVKEHPSLIKYVKNKEMSWQSFYEIYDLYGDKDTVWKEYLNKDASEEKPRESTSGGRTFNDFLNMAKNLDTDKIQNGISSLQKAISLFGDLIVKKDDSIPNTYTPRPLYKTFED